MNKKILSLVVLATTISGCAYEIKKKNIEEIHASTESLIKNKTKEAMPFTVRPVFVKTQKLWLGNKAIPLAQEASLPAVFSENVTLVFPGRMGLAAVAEKITKATGIPVRLQPDVFMSRSMFISSGQQQKRMTQSVAQKTAINPLATLPAPLANAEPPVNGEIFVPSAYQAGRNHDEMDDLELNYREPLIGILNSIGSKLGINWEYTEANGITYSRFVTKTFAIKTNPGDSSITASLGKGNSSGNSFSSDGQVKMKSEFSVWEGIQKTLDTIKSPVGKFHISQATGSVTITDTRDVVERVEKFISNENDMLTKQVAVRLEMYSVSSNDDVESGVNWDLVYTKFSELAPQFSLSLMSPASLTSAMAGNMGLSILAPVTEGGRGIQAFNGTSAFVKALQAQGKVARVQSVSAMTLNRQPVPIGVTNQISYLARTTAGSAGVGAALPGLEPGQVTTGFMVNLLPTVLDSNSVLLQFSIDLTELQRIGVVSTGFGTTQQSIQTPEVNGTQFVQRVALKAGSTLVLSGYERNRDDYEQRGITKSVGLGGSFVGKNNRESIIIMITPVIVAGAA